MINTNYLKIANDIEFNSWNIEEIEKSFIDVAIPNESTVYIHPSGMPHWQLFKNTNIAFSRNFYYNFKEQCIEVSEKLINLQKSMQYEDNALVKKFINHKITPHRVVLMKAIAGYDVLPHCDVTRNISINIGLKNSNIGTTYISENKDFTNFWAYPNSSFTMQDGDVYLLQVENAHTVTSNVPKSDNLARYIISYHLEFNSCQNA